MIAVGALNALVQAVSTLGVQAEAFGTFSETISKVEVDQARFTGCAYFRTISHASGTALFAVKASPCPISLNGYCLIRATLDQAFGIFTEEKIRSTC